MKESCMVQYGSELGVSSLVLFGISWKLLLGAGTYFITKIKSCINFGEHLETLEHGVNLLLVKASDMKRDVENQELSGRKKRLQQVESWLNEVEQLEEEFHQLKEAARRGEQNIGVLEKMDGRVGELLEKSRHFGELVFDAYESEECPMQVQPVQEETSKQNIEVIWTWLQDENASSIGIYGFSIKGLQDDLAKIMKLDLSAEDDEHRRADRLNRAFRQMKNIVIILDDVWDRLSSEELGYPLCEEGCRLILTSRSSEV
ncbi:hypothetical protein T459_24380 [Capsicum annuum]|uniref:NB-ARC domain-containing protein n=1 Tax=Capsicum annuum TaxID=4072 RepID=A0A2G2YVD0_CAPAN|nr:hypothetical protein T459_24380 [Capsicum annuum]